MTMTIDETRNYQIGWLRDRVFDSWFIGGITIIGILSAIIVTIEPSLFVPILVLDIWLLGYHHVISTFTRLCFDRKSFEENKFLVIWLPLICLLGVALTAKVLGVWALTTIYFYWQWFHYTKQSWGVSQAYRRSDPERTYDGETFSKWVIYAIPAAGILHRMYQSPDLYLGFELWTPEIPFSIYAMALTVSAVVLTLWIIKRVQLYMRGELPIAHTAYMLSHIIIFAVGYILIEDVTYGWLAINIWHNAQYIMFVWHFNNKKYNQREGSQSTFIGRLSQTKNWKKYMFVCALISTAAYIVIAFAEPMFAVVGLAPMIIIYQTINFHHYIVDSIIWKAKRMRAKA